MDRNDCANNLLDSDKTTESRGITKLRDNDEVVMDRLRLVISNQYVCELTNKP